MVFQLRDVVRSPLRHIASVVPSHATRDDHRTYICSAAAATRTPNPVCALYASPFSLPIYTIYVYISTCPHRVCARTGLIVQKSRTSCVGVTRQSVRRHIPRHIHAYVRAAQLYMRQRAADQLLIARREYTRVYLFCLYISNGN